jgi:release factor glutamine methyltransferase
MIGVARLLTPMDVRTALKTGIAKLREASVPSFTLSAELLLLHVATRDRTWLYSHPEENLPQEITDRFFALIARRAEGEPTQYLTGKQEFWGLEFEVTPDVLIPRPETEHVIEVALDRLALRELRAGRPQKTIGEGLRIADIGTGSGCIAIALAKELPKAEFVATDISRAALEVAGRNAVRHGVGGRIRFVQGDLLESRATPFRSGRE